MKDINNKPLVSIITVVFNGEKYIENSIKSVLEQNYENIQYIIIDGASQDNTSNIIKKYQHAIDYYISEKDNGIYNAMNKGLKQAKGKYIAILNADDYYNKNAVKHSIEAIEKNNFDYSYANVRFENSTTTIRAIYPLKQGKIYQEMPYPHVSAFIKAEIYNKVGFFDEVYKIAADHDMALKIHLAGYRGIYLDEEVARLEAGGVSASIKSNKESLKIAIKHGKNRFKAYISFLSQISKIYIVKFLPNSIVDKILKLKKSRFGPII